MTRRQWVALLVITVLIVIAGIALFVIPAKAPAIGTPATSMPIAASIADTITVNSPTIGAQIYSPLAVAGEARGPWYFEAVFPVKLLDASGRTIAQGQANAQSDWMTGNFVPFNATIAFPPQPTGSKGTLILMNDNPSGNPAKAQEFGIPIVFR